MKARAKFVRTGSTYPAGTNLPASPTEPSTSGENQAQEKQKEVVSEILAKGKIIVPVIK